MNISHPKGGLTFSVFRCGMTAPIVWSLSVCSISQPSSPCSMDHLPIEIVLDILSISEPETIATFLRTASKYRESAEPLLYDSIILKGPEARQGLLLSLEAKPHFAARVRHLAAHWKNAAYYALTPLLARTSNLESLVLRGFHRGIYHSSLSRLPRLRAVDCDCSPVVPRVITFLSEIPNLRSITLTLREYAVVSPNSPVLAETWARILTTPAAYSGPAFVLTFMPRGTSVVHVQTRGPEPVVVDALEHMRDATAGALVSLECTPLPLHPPSMGSYFPNLQFLGLFQIMTIPPQCVWVRTPHTRAAAHY